MTKREWLEIGGCLVFAAFLLATLPLSKAITHEYANRLMNSSIKRN